MRQLKAFNQGLFDYNECFFGVGGFLSPEANEEKHLMSFYLEALVEELAAKEIVFGKNQPLRWLEPAIGDGSSTVKFIKAISGICKTGIIIHGSDYQADSVAKARLELEKLKSADVSIGELLIKDAFSGDVLASTSCDFALLSHFIYHLKNQLDGGLLQAGEIDDKLSALIGSVMHSLDKNGLALAFHEGPTSDMFGNLGLRYGSAMNDATDRIAQAASTVNKVIVRMPLESKLYFPDLSDVTLEKFKNLDNWKNYSEDSPEASWLKKFLFALHNTPQPALGKKGGAYDLALQVGSEGHATRLAEAIDYLKGLFQRDYRGPYITIRSEMQAIINNPELKPQIEDAFLAVQQRLPELRKKTQLALARASVLSI